MPLSVYNGEPQYNPCSHAQYCLTLHGQYVRTGSVAILEKFLTQLDVFLSRMEEDGSHRYNFAYPYYVDPENLFEPGWVSAMVNGHVLSLCARAYQLTEDEKYFEFAERALKFLQTPIEDGGVMTTLSALDPSLSGYTIWEEYPAIPATYTLNGFEFTLIGVYDWSCIKSPTQKLAKEMFDDGVRTLEKILPYYDIGGFTAYDLSHITWNRVVPHIGVGYHSEHTAFCKIFYDITGIETFNEYYQLWASYAE